jgi:hypothetical protein
MGRSQTYSDAVIVFAGPADFGWSENGPKKGDDWRRTCSMILPMKSSARSALGLVALFTGTFIVVACSSSSDSTFSDPPKPDAEPDAPGTLVPLEGGGPDAGGEAGPASCPPSIPPTFAPTWKPPTKSAACSTADIAAYYAACLANPGTTEKDGTCAKFKADHATCAACAEPADNSGPVQWQLQRAFYTSNIAGCIAVAQGMPEVGKCGEAYNAAVQCSRAACEFCFGLGGTFQQFSTCQQEAGKQGVCKSYETVQSTACAGYTAAGSPALKCVKSSSAEANDVYFERVVGVICGP